MDATEKMKIGHQKMYNTDKPACALCKMHVNLCLDKEFKILYYQLSSNLYLRDDCSLVKYPVFEGIGLHYHPRGVFGPASLGETYMIKSLATY